MRTLEMDSYIDISIAVPRGDVKEKLTFRLKLVRGTGYGQIVCEIEEIFLEGFKIALPEEDKEV